MNRNTILVSLLALGVGLLLAGAFFATFERKDVTQRVPAHGEASFNRFFALDQSLRRLDFTVASLTSLDPRQMPLRPGDTLVLGDDISRIDVDDARRIVAWVRNGGHLLLSPGSPASAVHTPLFEALNLLDARPAEFACSAIRASGAAGDKANDEVQLCGQRFRLNPVAGAAVDAAIGNLQDGYLFARTKLDAGSISLLVDMDVISREQLRSSAAQQFAWRLLAPNLGQGEIYLVYALDGMSFLKLLLLKGWPALLALSLLLAAWMAMRSERFGPLMPAPALHRRALLEHVQAAGEFIYRRDSGRSLHNLACQAVLTRLRRRDPACVMLNGDALYARLAQRSQLAPEQIAQAFQSPANAQAFRACITTLARLRSRP
ncbi:DUF4350 domain-containing protein [Rhodanobacter sp. C03]|uniref:DUF4350 domain-containing protein n=1 Tax=Rhodanobacter sp. C03 TaxID=1945858 RepID=UPI0009870728|nr:DUF4350 domain-containing protein [Rhodanobacter sp. C03]OOG59877.1 hypothetical protein B0E48_03570 [Rhodanobacter sp. C03]